LHPSHQFPRTERLGDIVFGELLNPLNYGLLLVHGRQKDDG
jgi:hypothetical protein